MQKFFVKFLVGTIDVHEGLGGMTPSIPSTSLAADTPTRPADQKTFTLPLLDVPATIMYKEENVLCKKALKFKFTLSSFRAR